MTPNAQPRTLFEKIWDDHIVHAEPNQQTILYIDLQLVHEVTSAQAFEGLRLTGRKVRRPGRNMATADHNVPTTARSLPITDPIALQQIEALRQNCAEFGIHLYDIHDPKQGIVHVIGPELGLTQPGLTIVCGDSHTATHGAFGALAFGFGVLPLAMATGAGAGAQTAIGTGVLGGMATATFLAIFFIPLFFVGVMQLFGKKPGVQTAEPGSDTLNPPEGQ